MDEVHLSSMKHGEDKVIDLDGQVLEIYAYVGDSRDLSILTKLIPILSKKPIIFSYDLIFLTKKGKIRLRMNPLLTHIQRGIIVEGTTLNISKIRKVENSPFFFFMIEN